MNEPGRPLELLTQLLDLPFVEASTGDSDKPARVDMQGCTVEADAVELLLRFETSADFFETADAGEQARVERDFRRRFAEIVAEVTVAWGEPTSATNALGPAEIALERELQGRGRLAAAYWRRGDRLAYVDLEHPFAEFPFIIVLGVRKMETPESEGEEEMRP